MQVHRDFGDILALSTVDLPFEIGPSEQRRSLHLQKPSAGDYRLAGVADVEPGQWSDPAFLRSLSGAVTVTVADGSTHTQEVRVK